MCHCQTIQEETTNDESYTGRSRRRDHSGSGKLLLLLRA